MTMVVMFIYRKKMGDENCDNDHNNDHDENNDCPPCGIRGEPIEDPKHECCDNHCTEDSDPHLGFQNLIAMITADMIT